MTRPTPNQVHTWMRERASDPDVVAMAAEVLALRRELRELKERFSAANRVIRRFEESIIRVRALLGAQVVGRYMPEGLVDKPTITVRQLWAALEGSRTSEVRQ